MNKSLTIIILLIAMISYGQNKKKPTLGLLSFESLNIDNYAEAEFLTETVKEIFVASKRFKPLDRSLYAETSIFTEIEVQKNINFINGHIVKQGKLDGAKFLVGGKLTSVGYKQGGNGEYNCTINFSISIIDIETGETMDTKTFSKMADITPDGLDKTSAMANEIKTFRKKIQNFIINYSPYEVEIHKIKKVGRNGEIIIIAGKEEGIAKGNRFAIYEVTDVNGKLLKEEITQFNINELKGDFSSGKIKRKDIDNLIDLFEDPDVNLSCESIPSKSII
ncbi:hypothetical protein [Winogradskyella tangerina]|uniref:hypothetical protein n=1 Tax=Winogradskyella tangerina TaxID=2023240 RepID=UPI0013001A27|nr:hypothetical protein [Winogradskyella tangerina]